VIIQVCASGGLKRESNSLAPGLKLRRNQAALTSRALAGAPGTQEPAGRTRWHLADCKRIFETWLQSSNAIAAPSTDALMRSSWYRIPVTHPVRSAGLR
jgi:hypothetical protein